jgi:predicted phage tail protein
MNTIRLYGPLAKFIGRKTFEVDISTAAESIRFLEVTFPQIKRHMRDQWYVITVGRHKLGLNELHYPIGNQELRIIPVFSGAITLDQILNPSGGTSNPNNVPTTSSSSSSSASVGGLLGGLISAISGASPILAIGAAVVGIGALYVANQLSKPAAQVGVSATPIKTDNDPRTNFSFNGIQNTARAGVPVPIVYGEVVTGSVVISAGIDTVQGKD